MPVELNSAASSRSPRCTAFRAVPATAGPTNATGADRSPTRSVSAATWTRSSSKISSMYTIVYRDSDQANRIGGGIYTGWHRGSWQE